MKFKSIFILFNGIILFSFIFVFTMPFFTLGIEFALSFWSSNWPLALILLIILGAVDGFFMMNLRLFSLLEKEDWPGLAHYLEERVIQGKRYSSRLVRLLANTYLVLSDSASVIALEEKTRAAKPVLVERNALVFGTARILSGDHAGALRFFQDRIQSAKVEYPQWVRWFYAFTLLLNKDFEEAADTLAPLCSEAKDPLVVALSAYFLQDSVVRALPERSSNLQDAAGKGRERVKQALPTEKSWVKEYEKARSEIHVVILSKSLEDARRFIYDQGA